MSKQTAVEWLEEQFNRERFIEEIDFKTAKLMEAEQQNQLAIEFAEWVLVNEHIDTIWSTPKKELFQIFLKTKSA